MKPNKEWLIFLGAIYLVIGIFSFGHSAAGTYNREQAEYQKCRAATKAGFCMNMASVDAVINGIGAGIFWPLYLSWESQS